MTENYRLKDGVQAVVASDLTLERGDTVELEEDEADAINERRDEPVIERAGGDGGGDGE